MHRMESYMTQPAIWQSFTQGFLRRLPTMDWLLSIGPREMERADIFTSVPLHRLALESDEHPEVLPDLYRIAAQALRMEECRLAGIVTDNLSRISPP